MLYKKLRASILNDCKVSDKRLEKIGVGGVEGVRVQVPYTSRAHA